MIKDYTYPGCTPAEASIPLSLSAINSAYCSSEKNVKHFERKSNALMQKKTNSYTKKAKQLSVKESQPTAVTCEPKRHFKRTRIRQTCRIS